jgi:hypothetical protein
MTEKILNHIGNFNPQFFREIKGRFKQKYITITAIISVIGQFLIYTLLKAQLPKFSDVFNRYCVGIPPQDLYQDSYSNYPLRDDFCIRDNLGNIIPTHIFHQLWWLDLFITLSIVGIFVLLVGGTYMLIADLSKEENSGTLNFIRLSPQSAKTIFIGKILGVPSLIYLACLLAIPLHIIAGIFAHVSLPLICLFYLVTIFSCIFFYNVALLYGLVSANLMGFQSFLGSGIVLFFLFCVTGIAMDGNLIFHNSFDWLTMFNPVIILPYLINSTLIQPETVNYLKLSDLQELQFYGQNLWNNLFFGINLMICNYCLWTYWITQGLKRRFHNPLTTLITKKQGYGICICFAFMNLGFTLQANESYNSYDFFGLAMLFNLALFLVLTAALSPHRQELQDWARYRHQTAQRHSLINDLITGEKSPSTLAMVLIIAITSLYFIPAILLFPFSQEDSFALLWGLLLSSLMAFLYTTIAQWMLLIKNPKRAIWTSIVIVTMMILPYVCLGILNLDPAEHWLWLFTILPVFATKYNGMEMFIFSFIAQVITITLFNSHLTKQLNQAGKSETNAILTSVRS